MAPPLPAGMITVSYCPVEERWFIGPQHREELHPEFHKGYTHTTVRVSETTLGRTMVLNAIRNHNRKAAPQAVIKEPTLGPIP